MTRVACRRNLLGVAFLAAVASAFVPAGAQTGTVHGLSPNPAAGIADVPAGSATLRGRVVHDTDPDQASGIPLVLYALGADGTPGLRGLVSQSDGSFAFENISNDPNTVYLVGAHYREVPFGIRVSFEPGERLHTIEVPITDPTTDAATAGVADVSIWIDWGCKGLLIRESHQLENTGERVIYVPESERAGREPILRISLPMGATNLDVADNLDWDGTTLSYWGPLRPGREGVEFTYAFGTSESSTAIRRRFPSGGSRVRVFSRAQGPSVVPAEASGPTLAAREPVTLKEHAYAVLEATELAPGDAIAFAAAAAPPIQPTAGLEVLQARIWLDADGAALTIDEQHQFSVAGGEPITSVSGAPLFCFQLGADAEELQFSNDTLKLGLSRDPSGAVGVSGPIPPGESSFALRYRIPVDGDVVTFERSLPFEVPLLSVLIADNGLMVETERLHRRNPLRTSDRTFLHLEAFGIEAHAPIALTLQPLDTRQPLTKFASTGFAFCAALLAIGFLTVPLRRADDRTSAEPAPSPVEEERQSVLAALRSLEDDFDTAKISQSDYAELRLQLRTHAVELLQRQREPDRGGTPTCADCGAIVPSEARFCSQCGARVAQDAPNAGSTT